MKNKKSIYFRKTFRRQNTLLEMILTLSMSLCSYPRLIIEVFIRKNFGERYFNLASAITVGIVLFIIPLLSLPGRSAETWIDVLKTNFLWYAYLAAFAFFSRKRWIEVRRNPSVFDFGTYSLSAGEGYNFFFTLKPGDVPATPRSVEIFWEPILFFISGIALLAMGQSLGLLLTVSSIIYSLSYMAMYKMGDDFIMDLIDNKIMADMTRNIIVLNHGPEKTKGARFYGRKPQDPALREIIANEMIEDDDDEAPLTAA